MLFDKMGLKKVGMIAVVLLIAQQVEAKSRVLEVQSLNSAALSSRIAELAAQLTPTLPAPVLMPEPPFTVGRLNTLYWDLTAVSDTVSNLGYKLLYFEIQALFNDSELFSPVEADVDSATFTNGSSGLPEGIPISYRLRYFAQNLVTLEYAMSEWSEPEVSIQDVLPPVLYQNMSGIVNGELSGDKYWVMGESIDLRVVASDSAVGKIEQVRIYETSEAVSDSLSYDFDLPATYVDTTISFSLKSPVRESVLLTWKVVDLSGQSSEPMVARIYSWPKDETQVDRVICFPNPFVPGQGQIISIKTDAPDVTEARIFDLFGNQIQVLTKDATELFFEWNGRNTEGQLVARGGYLCVVKGMENLYCKIAVIR